MSDVESQQSTGVRERVWRIDLACGEYAQFSMHYHPASAEEAAAQAMDSQFAVGAQFGCAHGPCRVERALRPQDRRA